MNTVNETTSRLSEALPASITQADGTVLVCNYADNYYGDQACIPLPSADVE